MLILLPFLSLRNATSMITRSFSVLFIEYPKFLGKSLGREWVSIRYLSNEWMGTPRIPWISVLTRGITSPGFSPELYCYHLADTSQSHLCHKGARISFLPLQYPVPNSRPTLIACKPRVSHPLRRQDKPPETQTPTCVLTDSLDSWPWIPQFSPTSQHSKTFSCFCFSCWCLVFKPLEFESWSHHKSLTASVPRLLPLGGEGCGQSMKITWLCEADSWYTQCTE